VNHLFLSVCAAGLSRHLRIAAKSIINPEKLGCLMENPHLPHVQSLDIDVGGRPGGASQVVAFGQMSMVSMPQYEKKLQQLAAGISELLSRTPGILTLRSASDIPQS
jgi:hypothetical protein